MKVKEIIAQIEKVVPVDWALEDDPIGFLAGDPEQETGRVLVGLEVSTAFLQKAGRHQAGMLFVHHPLIYRPMKRLLESDPVQRLVRETVRQNLSLYAAHTNFDLHPEGMSKLWAQKLGCAQAEPLVPRPQGKQLKLVTFVPSEYTSRVREALSTAGAGIIGEYDSCSYTLHGEGSFRGSKQSNPFSGKSGVLESVQEDRLEMILPEHRKWAVVRALMQSHPYEEPAYDLHLLDTFRDLRQALWQAEFSKAISWSELEQRIHKSLPKLETPGGVHPNKKHKIKRLAISTGSGGSFISTVASLNVDVYLTGEVGYHQLWEAHERGLNVITVGHDHSESFFAEAIIPLLSRHGGEVQWIAE